MLGRRHGGERGILVKTPQGVTGPPLGPFSARKKEAFLENVNDFEAVLSFCNISGKRKEGEVLPVPASIHQKIIGRFSVLTRRLSGFRQRNPVCSYGGC
ncbi:hypothetical protein NL676_024953 [Syzygium grande]|nr:hypothetical protein NL676_024953 [Syzygium grande]